MSNENDELPVKGWYLTPEPDALVLLSDAQRIRDERDRLHDRVHDLLSELSKAVHERERLMEIARWLDLATDEGDDIARGTHYVDKDGRIRCKGSFLAVIEKARAALAGEKS